MNILSKVTAFFLSAAALALASSTTLYYRSENLGAFGCMSLGQSTADKCYDANGKNSLITSRPDARIRILRNMTSSSGNFGIYLDKPFFIIDGIHLSTTEARTLNQLEKEAEEFGIPEILTSLGYTPILVQFSQTVRTSLQSNSKTFANLLRYLNNGVAIPFPNKKEDGFIVLGISQGGILGRYGSYLYDTKRTSSDAPIRLYSSLDSPHQGAVMPRSLISTIDFWANDAGVASAEAFYDLIASPGARDLLIYDTETGKPEHGINTASSRFLFNDYRKAAEYKGFPAILISQGQLKGKDPAHENKYYELNRKASLLGRTLGRAESSMSYSDSDSKEYSYNRMYQIASDDIRKGKNGNTRLDFVQGSTYPFAKTMYESLREGILDEIPDEMSYWEGYGIIGMPITLNTQWDADKLYQESSTFIPTVSAMDFKCDGDLAIRKNCAHSLTASQVSFEKPGSQSSATSIYAVDPTHPRYRESISGRHIESPVKDDRIDNAVLSGMQVDIWRVLCEVAKHDYNPNTKKFRNVQLTGFFSPSTNCMDTSKMPEVIKNGGVIQTKKLSYARFDFNKSATEQDLLVRYNLPAGWQKVATFDNGGNIPAGSTFEFAIAVNNPKGNWMKAELLLTREKDGGAQIQLSEVWVPQDGRLHLIRWQIPGSSEMLKNYRWVRLVLNSNGGDVVSSQPLILTNTQYLEDVPEAIKSPNIYPNNTYSINTWSNNVSFKEQTIGSDNILEIKTAKQNDGLHFNFARNYSMDRYSNLVVTYVPGTCQNTMVYFGGTAVGAIKLNSGSSQGNLVSQKIPLSSIINTQITPKGSLSASRLSLQAKKDSETCKIKSINLQ